MTKRCKTAAELIDALGGVGHLARRFDVDYGVVWNWKVRGFPPDTFHAFHHQLMPEWDISAPPSLWGQREIT